MEFSKTLRAIKANARLGWQQEGNWAPPLVYIMFALIAPVMGILLLVFMYLVVKGDSTDASFLAFLLGGSAMFLIIRMVLTGAGHAVVEDREHYKILRYIYIAPVPFPAQIFGRIVIKLVISIIGAFFTILAGAIFLNITLRTSGILWIDFLGSFVVGVISVVAIGWILASIMLLVDRMGWVWAEGVSGLMFLTAGAIIPLELLPTPMVWMSKILPMTYWGDIWRISLYGNFSDFAQPALSKSELWAGFGITTFFWIVVSIIAYYYCDKLARKTGKIERETFY